VRLEAGGTVAGFALDPLHAKADLNPWRRYSVRASVARAAGLLFTTGYEISPVLKGGAANH